MDLRGHDALAGPDATASVLSRRSDRRTGRARRCTGPGHRRKLGLRASPRL